ncbi:gas vesicle protein K [Candidatus Chloroploca sp. M-50]|uniref:Gas vesicle protein K n=1 Tax=Candidatus Chloroploca mongolica TaxID=2528176 RepID=A0ABS4DC81_9CHLR|nr:gas vesicle protein K [Candidatus Chloroploca mongolica]MBP1467050.1 gas vesicle protein K [Candidatus Chloroploca mongolica]
MSLHEYTDTNNATARCDLEIQEIDDLNKVLCAPEDRTGLVAELGATRHAHSGRITLDPDKVESGLAQLVLTVVELLRQLMERQALHRIEDGSLDDEAIERLGLTFMRLDERMKELKEVFGLTDEDLNIDLGPLGKLL